MQVLEKYFDTAFDATDGIKKLRELILTLAMQGKIVPQDPNDQPASELLKGIEEEKQQLIKDGKIKKSKPLGQIQESEIPFEIPSNWKWRHIRDIGYDWGQKTPNNEFTYIDVGSIDNKNGKIKNSTQVLKASEAPSRARKIVKYGTIIYSTVRPYLLNIAIIDKEYLPEPIASTAFAIIHPFNKLDNKFIYYYLNSPIFIKYVELKMKGVAYPAINDGDFFSGLIPIPPYKEQKRIVEKINQLMGLCDELEKLKEQKETKKLTVHKSAINQLLDSKDKSNSQKGWHFISSHFNDLYTVKENVSELRGTILQLAMQGKLVPQDPNDQPASELLKEIEKEKKANKVKSLEPIKSELLLYDLPNGWQWVYLNDFGVWKSGSTPSRTNSAYYGGNIPWVKSGEVKQGFIKNTEETITQKALDECSLGLNPIGSILVAMYGANIGEVGILGVEATTNQAICACQTFSRINNHFLKFLIDSLKGYFISQGAGAAQPNISRVKIINSIVPLPPLNEQQRIVEKINQLMALCDELEQQIENSSSKQTQLLNAIMSNLGK